MIDYSRYAPSFEAVAALSSLSPAEALSLLEVSSFIEGASTQDDTIERLIEAGVLVSESEGTVGITYLGALMFAKDLTDFSSVSRKALRVAVYKDHTRASIERLLDYPSGYALALPRLFDYLDGVWGRQKRSTPSLNRVMDILGLLLSRQDLSLRGMSVILEVFSDHVEVSCPGAWDITLCPDAHPNRNPQFTTLMTTFVWGESVNDPWARIVATDPQPTLIQYPDAVRLILR